LATETPKRLGGLGFAPLKADHFKETSALEAFEVRLRRDVHTTIGAVRASSGVHITRFAAQSEPRALLSFSLFWRFGVLAANPSLSPIVRDAEGCDAARLSA